MDIGGIGALALVLVTVGVVPAASTFPGMPAAVLDSGLVAADSGSFEVHWGEVWATGDIRCPNNGWSRWPKSLVDPWFAVRCGGYLRNYTGILYADGSEGNGTPGSDDGFVSVPPMPASANYHSPFLDATLARYNGNYKNLDLVYRENLLQHQTLTLPDLSYATIKQWVLDNGYSYYRATADGLVEDPVSGQIAPFDQWFSRLGDPGNPLSPLDPDDIAPGAPFPVVFIDTPSAVAPDTWLVTNGALPEIDISGSDPRFFHGLFFIASDFRWIGAGEGATFDGPVMPDDTTSNAPIEIVLHGFLHTYGKATFSGNPGIYGAISAARGFDGGGTLRVYYNASFANPVDAVALPVELDSFDVH